MGVRHINPEGLHRSPAFSQAVVVEQPAKTIYIGGQNGIDAERRDVAGRRVDPQPHRVGELHRALGVGRHERVPLVVGEIEPAGKMYCAATAGLGRRRR